MPEARCTLLTVQSVCVKLAEEWLLGPMAVSVIHLIQEVLVSPEPRLFRGSCRGGAARVRLVWRELLLIARSAQRPAASAFFFCMNSFGLELGLGASALRMRGLSSTLC